MIRVTTKPVDPQPKTVVIELSEDVARWLKNKMGNISAGEGPKQDDGYGPANTLWLGLNREV